MSEEIIIGGGNGKENSEISQPEKDNKNPNGVPEQDPKQPAPITDFKVAEIWIKSGNVFLEASESFWEDKCRAIGLLEFCMDIVKTARLENKNKIIPATHGMMDFVRRGFRKKKK